MAKNRKSKRQRPEYMEFEDSTKRLVHAPYGARAFDCRQETWKTCKAVYKKSRIHFDKMNLTLVDLKKTRKTGRRKMEKEEIKHREFLLSMEERKTRKQERRLERIKRRYERRKQALGGCGI